MDAPTLVPQYASSGIAVGPLCWITSGSCSCGKTDCHSPGKHPLWRAAPNGKDSFTTNIGQIAEWLAEYPLANWGGRPPAGVVVLDVDPRNGGDVELARLEALHGKLPLTLTQRTGGGGLHLLYSYDGPARGGFCTGVDVKTNTGYIVLAPSNHISGGRYEWAKRRPASYLPKWARTILNPPTVKRVFTSTGDSIDGLVRWVSDATPNLDRNKRLYWAACRAYDNDLDPTPLIDAAVTTGLPEHAARATVESAQRRKLTHPSSRKVST